VGRLLEECWKGAGSAERNYILFGLCQEDLGKKNPSPGTNPDGEGNIVKRDFSKYYKILKLISQHNCDTLWSQQMPVRRCLLRFRSLCGP
jgi:hypothetical protein